MSNNVKFSVLFPTKNRLDLLKHGINSVLNQDYNNWEIIVSDNCSQDDVKGYIDSLNDERIKYIRQEKPLSVCSNWNAANDQATGDYVIMLGDDDALLPYYFTTCLKEIVKNEDLELIYHSVYYYKQPNVSMYEPDGWVKSSKPFHPITKATDEPYILDKNARLKEIQSTLNMWYTFGFNAQFFLYSKELIQKMEKHGKFYQPPFPDTYAANMMMLIAEKVVIIPQELVILGITPKSYGWYAENNKEKEGMTFHKDADYREYAPKSIKSKLCNIAEMQTAAFATLALIPEKFPERKDLKLITKSYFKRVIERVINESDKKEANEVLSKEVYSKMSLLHRMELYFYAKKLFKKKKPRAIVLDKSTSYENVSLLIEDIVNKKQPAKI